MGAAVGLLRAVEEPALRRVRGDRAPTWCTTSATATGWASSPPTPRRPYILNFFDLGRDRPAAWSSCRPVRPPAGSRTSGSASSRVMGEMGPDHGQRRQAPGRAARPGPRPTVEDGILRPARDRDEHHVRVPHPRPRPAAVRRRWSRRSGSTPIADRDDPPPTRIVSPDGEPGPATSRAAWTTGSGCTTSTSARSSTNATASTWPCSSSSASRRASRSRPDDRLAGDPDPGVGGRGADGAGQHVRQALPRRPLVARPAVGPGHRPRQLRASAATTTTSCSSGRPGSTRRSASRRR